MIVLDLILTCIAGWEIIDNGLLKPASEHYPMTNYIFMPLFLLGIVIFVIYNILVAKNGVLKSVKIGNQGIGLIYEKSILFFFNRTMAEKDIKWDEIDRIVYYHALNVSFRFNSPSKIYLIIKNKMFAISAGEFASDMQDIKQNLDLFRKVEETWNPLEISKPGNLGKKSQ